MAQTSSVDDLLTRLGLGHKKAEPPPAVAAVPAPPAPPSNPVRTSPRPVSETVARSTSDSDAKRREAELRLKETLARLKAAPHSESAVEPEVEAEPPILPEPDEIRPEQTSKPGYWPRAPRSLVDAGVTESELTSLILKFLSHRGTEAGFRIAVHLGLKFPVLEPVMRQLKIDKLVVYKSSMTGGDYLYELTDLGRDRARQLSVTCTYYGTAPVPLSQYIQSVKSQSITALKPSLQAIRGALSDLNINPALLSNIGQAIHSGRGMFLFGAPGNGKTSIAERVTKAFGDTIWIPKCISAAGEIIRFFDPNRQRPVPVEDPQIIDEVDGRWVLIERPTIVAGGELRMDNLEITVIRNTGIGEAPLQLKANCGTLLIDDFGRQRMPVDELLNRWIIPLEQRHDFLQLESGRSIQVPFDELIIFSTNLEPRDLVDDAFLRRIPYKIEVKDPTAAEFKALLLSLAKQMNFQCDGPVVDYLIQTHYTPVNRRFRFCHPRDLLRQVENRCTLHNLQRVVTREAIDQAVSNYFSIM